MQTVQPVSTAKIDVSPMPFQQLHSCQLLSKNSIVDGCESLCVSLVDPLSLLLPVEVLRVCRRPLLVESEDEVHGLEIAAIGGCVQE